MYLSKTHERTILEISQGDYISVKAESLLIDGKARELSRHFSKEFLMASIPRQQVTTSDVRFIT